MITIMLRFIHILYIIFINLFTRGQVNREDTSRGGSLNKLKCASQTTGKIWEPGAFLRPLETIHQNDLLSLFAEALCNMDQIHNLEDCL